jgi:hypothetical protein
MPHLQEQGMRGTLPLHPDRARSARRADHQRMTAMADLVQIRQGYQANWDHFTLRVESGDRQWTLQVQDAGSHQLLYKAGRANRAAAQNAGAEFAVFHGAMALQTSPESVARELNWRKYW